MHSQRAMTATRDPKGTALVLFPAQEMEFMTRRTPPTKPGKANAERRVVRCHSFPSKSLWLRAEA